MQTQSHTMQQSAPTLVIVDPLVTRFTKLRKRMKVSIILTVIGWGVIIACFLLASKFSSSSTLNSFIPLYIFVFACGLFSWPLSIFTTIKQEHFWKRLEQRRQEAAAGEQSLLAAQQPVPNAQALSLPLTIRQRPNWFSLLLLPGIMIVLSAILLPIMFSLLPRTIAHRQVPSLVIPIFIGIAVALILIYCVVIFAILYYKSRKQLTITEHGLIIPGFRKAHSISWQEARLFAIDGIYGAKSYQHPSIFEVSSARDIVRWGWIRSNSVKVIFFAKPTVPAADYNQQMEAVLALIAGRTGLPLYDLRDKKGVS